MVITLVPGRTLSMRGKCLLGEQRGIVSGICTILVDTTNTVVFARSMAFNLSKILPKRKFKYRLSRTRSVEPP